MNKWPFWKNKQTMEESLSRIDINRCLEEGALPNDLPPELATFLERFWAAARSYYSSDALQKQTAFSVLQSQVNPHFLYNSLEAIRSEALLADCKGIAEMTEKLSRYYRYTISGWDNFVTIHDELFNLDDYLFIQQYRFGNRFSMQKIIEDDELLRTYLPKMTLQPLVENAIFHGLEQKKGEGRITVRISGTIRKIYIVISDDGVGMSQRKVDQINDELLSGQVKPKTSDHHSGIALANVNSRLRLHFGAEYGLRVNSTPHYGTDVEIVIPRLAEQANSYDISRQCQVQKPAEDSPT